ncbi:sphingomyelin phosphodiesterase [Frankliniella occidentalis]|uniref:Sphingomyelin phosphodiesterase n=1 Tax=Frankliniella occidentalis TaxID=133901 RepID=A0A6J1SBK8_FRAOC|nr:sphingomyelin phosphodiesterase [Frankliniella occidentalis]XP_052119481.1 sphingomyelin phosphodiesterase [Frankliniella occidentalis]
MIPPAASAVIPAIIALLLAASASGGPVTRSGDAATVEAAGSEPPPQDAGEWFEDDWDVAGPGGSPGVERYQVVEGSEGPPPGRPPAGGDVTSNDVDTAPAAPGRGGSAGSVLQPRNRTHVLPAPAAAAAADNRLRSGDQLDVETARQFQLLRINYTSLLADLADLAEMDGGALDMRAGRGLPRIVDKALWLFDLKQVVQEIETSVMSKVSCTACKAGVGLIQHYLRGGKSRDDINKIVYQFCVSLKIQSPRVCEGLTELFGGEVVHVLKRVSLGPEEVCSFVIGDACGDVYNPFHEWKVVFPPVSKPEVLEPKVPTEGAPSFKVLHLSDTHFDPYYQEGTNADCNEPLCCRLTNGPALSSSTAAGRWGDYRKCDTPKRTVDNMLQHIASTHPDIDYIIWTGDLPPHDVWNQTREENLSILKETVAQMAQLFPGIPIFPALGNHEAAPVNSFPPPFVQNDYSINWLYDELDAQWRQWLPSSVSRTVRRGAFYSVLVRPGFRIISLNMNYCNNKNWWLLLNSTDPAKELQWFIYELQSAEFNEEKVHVIGHIPPGHSDCLKVWSRNFYRIINRYESTIVSLFFGHTHYDEFELFYDTEDLGRAVGVAYIGPSVTPYYDLNPGYRIYYVDGDHKDTTRAVVDHETWVMNLKDANVYDYPLWYKEYSVRETYEMPSLLPQEWDTLINKIAQDGPLFDTYYRHYWKNSPVRPPCDGECKKRMICDMRSGKSHDRKFLCQEIESRIDANTRTGWRAWIYNGLALSMSMIMAIPSFTYQIPKYVFGLG